MPFTSPLLAGARVRPARQGLEVLLPNPSGGRGNYVVSWTDLNGLCRPTVHDTLLMQRVAALKTVTPTRIRQAAKQIASEGLAGRAAGSAAVAALALEQESVSLTRYQLLLRLVQQEESPNMNAVPPEAERLSVFEGRAERLIEAIAPRLSQTPDAVAAAVDELAALYDPIGLGDRVSVARLPKALGVLKLLRHEAMTLPMSWGDNAPALIKVLVGTADVTIAGVAQASAAARDAADRVLGLLASWFADPAALTAQITRADWLLDGWERICQLWAIDHTLTSRLDALDEIATLLPIVPREIGEWVGYEVDVEPVLQLRQLVQGREDWRTGLSVHDAIARNEALLAA